MVAAQRSLLRLNVLLQNMRYPIELFMSFLLFIRTFEHHTLYRDFCSYTVLSCNSRQVCKIFDIIMAFVSNASTDCNRQKVNKKAIKLKTYEIQGYFSPQDNLHSSHPLPPKKRQQSNCNYKQILNPCDSYIK